VSEKVVLVGAGGHAGVVVDILRLQPGSEFELVGFTDTNLELAGSEIYGLPVLGNDDILAELFAGGVRCGLVTVGAVRVNPVREKLYEILIGLGFELINAVHPASVIAGNVVFGRGNTVMAGVLINPGAVVNENVIINTGAVVEHDCHVGSHVHIGPGARIGGGVRIGEGAVIGMGATVLPSLRVGRRAMIGAGAVVVRDVPPAATVVGVPGQVVKCAGD
jgi:UDP-perosamine 4-acetyltransferase